MGCINSKASPAHEHIVVDKEIKKKSKKGSKRLISSSKKEEVVVEVDSIGNDARTRLISTEVGEEIVGNTASPLRVEEEKKNLVSEKSTMLHLSGRLRGNDVAASGEEAQMSKLVGILNGVEGAQVAAGWPAWLTNVAGEAIKGWLPRKADSFEKLDKIGQGTYSTVYRARDLETGKIVALKKVQFVNMDPESVSFMAREILILRRLDHPNIMKLEGLVTSRVSGNLYLVFEYMEHDLSGLAASPTIKFTEAQIKCYMLQLLHGLEHCHSRGVLHRDIKCSNLLISNNGNLKIADFGLANFYGVNRRKLLTSRVVTLWYRPPELLLGATNYGVAVDLWSAGCILAELYVGKPIMPGRTEVEQLHKIFKLCGSPSEEYWQHSRLPHATIFKPQHPYKRCFSETYKDIPSSALLLLDTLLAFEPELRGSASSALQSEFFTTKPLPCDPLSLPKYPPSKEFDIKVREEEARRQKAAGGKGYGLESRKGNRESKAIPAPDANAELQASIQKRREKQNPISISEQYNRDGQSGSGFLIDPTKGQLQNGHRHSRADQSGTYVNINGSSIIGSGRHDTGFRAQRSNQPQGAAAAQLSQFSCSVAVRGSSGLVLSRKANPNWSEEHFSARYNHQNDSESSHHLLHRPSSSHNKNDEIPRKESTAVYAPKKSRIHYSGPLFPSGGNMDDMLKEHEKQIQHAVFKARIDKTKNKKGHTANGQTESLLHYGGYA